MIHNHINVWLLRPGVRSFGVLPTLLDDTDTRPGAEQLGEKWKPIDRLWRLEGSALRDGSNAFELLGAIRLPRELVMIFEGGFVVIMAGGSRDFTVAWLDFEVASIELSDNSSARVVVGPDE